MKDLAKCVQKLVMCAHDECPCQANDGKRWGWVLEGEQPIWKKGAGCGQHLSEVICSTMGHLKDGGQILKYGKNDDGYWTGELFVKQVPIYIPLFAILLMKLQLQE